jgi:LysM repeat protein
MHSENENRSSEAHKPESSGQANNARQLTAEALGERGPAGHPVATQTRPDAGQPQTQALQSIDAIAQHSLDRALGGSSDEGQAPRFSDTYYAPVAANYDLSARSLAYEAARATGIQSVANMEVRAGDINLRGPVTFLDSGRQILFNLQDGRKYEILPPGQDTPKGSIVPFGRESGDAAPLAISQQRIASAFREGNAADGRGTSDAKFEMRPQPMATLEDRPGGNTGSSMMDARRPETPSLSPEQIAEIKQQLQEHPEWIPQLEQSRDPRAAMLLEIAGIKAADTVVPVTDRASVAQPPMPDADGSMRVQQTDYTDANTRRSEDRTQGTQVAQPIEAAAASVGGSQENIADKLAAELKAAEERKHQEEAIRHANEEEHKAAEQARRLAQMQAEQAAAAAAAIKGKLVDAREEDEDEPVDKSKRDEDKRRKYIVQPGDTLESIADKTLRDKRLAGLIYQLNTDVIPLIESGGKKFPKLTPKTVIWLPNTADIHTYRASLVTESMVTADAAEGAEQYAAGEDELRARFGDNWAGAAEAGAPPEATAGREDATAGGAGGKSIEEIEETARVAMTARHMRIESMLGPMTPEAAPARERYVVRLGDTLKSIAIKHPQLKDVQMWRLLARVNGLSDATERGDAPVVAVRRGQILQLPTAEEIAAFKGPVVAAAQQTESAKPATRRSISKLKTLKSQDSVGAAKAEAVAPPATPSGGANPNELPDGYTLIRQQGGGRIISCGDWHDSQRGLKIRMEVESDGAWLPVVSYEIWEDVSIRHEFKGDGSKKTIRINLPPQAAAELAHNDLLTNLSENSLKFGMRKQQ